MSGMANEISTAQKDEWLTPPSILDALGRFDLDPCAPISPPWQTASRQFHILDDGLAEDWSGRVWCNPPYGKAAESWLLRLAEHGNGIALTFARTETRWFFNAIWDKADAILFIKGRLRFHHVDGSKASSCAGAPSVLIAYGGENVCALKNSGIDGRLVIL